MIGLLIISNIIFLIYIRHLRLQIKSYQVTWDKIDEFADHNKDGDVVIHIEAVDDKGQI
jgi:hypothetical protein